MRWNAFAYILGGILSITSASAGEKWTPAAMMRVALVTDVHASPDGTQTAHTVTLAAMEEERSEYVTEVWYGSDPKSLAKVMENKKTKMGRFSPDGAHLAFLVVEDKIANLYVADPIPRPLTAGSTTIEAFRWSPDGRSIAFVRQDAKTDEDLHREAAKDDAYDACEAIKVKSLWVVDIATGNERQLTFAPICLRGGGDFNTVLEDFDWSPDSKEIAFGHISCPIKDSFYLSCSLAIVDAASGHIQQLFPATDHESVPRYSPDGKWLAYLESDQPTTYSITRYVTLRNRETGQRRRLSITPQEGHYLTGPSILGWTADSGEVLFFEPKKTRFQVYALSIDGKSVREVGPQNLQVYEANLNKTGTHLGFMTQGMDAPPEAAMSRLEGDAKWMSAHNAEFCKYPMAKSEIIQWNSADGKEIEGILTYPIGYDASRRYPLLVIIHGGPMGVFSEHFLGVAPNPYPIAAFAQEGYFILRANPRGSSGYGRAFRQGCYRDWGGMDFQDIMTGVDDVVARLPIDSKKIGVMGWSYGGYMAAWTVTQTNRFAAASMGAGISNLISMPGTSDLVNFLKDYLWRIRSIKGEGR